MLFHVTIHNRGDTATPSGVKHGVLFTVGGQTSTHVWSDNFSGPMLPGAFKSLDANGGRGGATCNPGGGPTTSPLWPGVSGQTFGIQVWVDNNDPTVGHITESDDSNNILNTTFSVP